MRHKFVLTMIGGIIWLASSIYFAIWWANDIIQYLPAIYVWWVIIGIALLPGFLMMSMFFSNIMHFKIKKYLDTDIPTTIIMCAHNEEENIEDTIRCVCQQIYLGTIHLLVIDNYSSDHTEKMIHEAMCYGTNRCEVEYVYCDTLGKTNALNQALELVTTKYFLTVDADTYLEPHAVQNIMNHITAKNSACVAGNLFVKNAKNSLITRMQNYDYLLSIAAIKRFQGSYDSTLVAQGAFSAYETNAVREIGGWTHSLGEDIILTYRLLSKGRKSTYEPMAVGYTTVPATFNGFYNQRKRWATGMIEGFSLVKPWQQKTVYSRYFTTLNLLIIYMDLAFLFGFIPGVIWAFFGYYYFVGLLTLLTVCFSILLFSSIYIYQKRLNIPFTTSLVGFICFLLFFQIFQSPASIHGYVSKILHQKGTW